jgi:hypothetical protein
MDRLTLVKTGFCIGILGSLLIFINGVYLAFTFVQEYFNPGVQMIPPFWILTSLMFFGVALLYGFILFFKHDKIGLHIVLLSSLLLGVFLLTSFVVYMIARTLSYFVELYYLSVIGIFFSLIGLSLQASLIQSEK